MRRCGNGFVLNSNLFIFLMVTVLCACTISKPRRERHGANSGSHGGSDGLNKRELRRTNTANSKLQDNDHQGEKHGPRTLEEVHFLIGILIGPGTGSIIPPPLKVVEDYEDKRQKREQDDPETDGRSETGKGMGAAHFRQSEVAEGCEDQGKIRELCALIDQEIYARSRRRRGTNTANSELQDNVHQGEKHGPRTLKEVDFLIGILIRPGTDTANGKFQDYEDQGKMHGPRTLEDLDFFTAIIIRPRTDTANSKLEDYQDQGEKYVTCTLRILDFSIRNKTRRGTFPKLSRSTILYVASEGQKKTCENHLDTNAGDERKLGRNAVIRIVCSANHYMKNKRDEVRMDGRTLTDYNLINITCTGPLIPPPLKVLEGYEDKRQKREQDDPETDVGKETGKGTGGTTRKMTTKSGTKVKEQRSSGNESDRTNLQNIKSGEDTADKAEASPAEYRHSAGKENEVKVREKSSKDPETGGQQGPFGTWEDRRIIDEKAAVEQCQNIWIPDALVIYVILGTLAVCLWSSYWFRRKRCQRGNDRAEGENDSPSGQEIRRPNRKDTRRPQTSLRKKRGRFASNKYARETGGTTPKTATELKPIKTEERPRGTTSGGEPGGVTRKMAAAIDTGIIEKHPSRNEAACEAEVIQISNKDQTTAVPEGKPGTLEDGRNVRGISGIIRKLPTDHEIEWNKQTASVNESVRYEPQTMETEAGTVDEAKTTAAEDKHVASNDAQVQDIKLTCKEPESGAQNEKLSTVEFDRKVTVNAEMSRKLPTDDDREMNQQPVSVKESDRYELQYMEIEKGTVDKANTPAAEDKHSAVNDGEGEDIEFSNKEAETGAQEEKPVGLERDIKIIEYSPDKMVHILASCNDLQLYRVVNKHREQLELAIKDVVENICETLVNEHRMPELNLQEINTLTRKNLRLEASQLLLKSVLHGNDWESRIFCNILTKMHVNLQCLMTSLTQDAEEEVILQHRYNLRVQSKNMKMPKLHFISDIYTVPKITLIHPEHDDATEESNNQVREVEIHELLKRRSSDPNKTNISVVYGAAGTGKTTLIQKIIHDWALGMKYEEFRFVLHFKIQNLNAIKGRITLSRLIADAYPYLENYMDNLWGEPNRLLFIFDDLNQLHRSIIFSDNERSSDPRHRCTGAESNCFVNDILRCLLQGEFLKGCSVLITARLWKQETLRHVAADSTFKVMGFTSEKVSEYFCRYHRSDQKANETVQLIERNDILSNMCSSPLFCVTLASSLESHQPQRNEKTAMAFINHTQVLFDYIAHHLEACGHDDNATQKCLLKIGELAYKGITRRTLSFSFEAGTVADLSTCPANILSAFMIQIQTRQSNDVVYEFTHSVVRDFLAALAKIINTPKSRLINILDETFMDPDRRLKIFSLFLVGLSSRKSTHRLKLVLGSLPYEVTSWISDCLIQSVKRRLTNVAGDFSKRTLLHTLYCLLEFEDNQIMTEMLTPITIKLNQLLLTSPDFAVLSRTLIYSEEIKELDLSSSHAEPEEIQKLEHLLHRCVILRLNQNNLQDCGVKSLFNILEKTDCKIQTLELKSNRLTDDCLCALFSTLSINRSLTLLNLSNYSQDGQHANQFTHERLQHHVDNYAQEKKIRWLRYEHIGRDTNCLIFITE